MVFIQENHLWVSQQASSTLINLAARTVDLPQEAHTFMSEEATFLRLWDMATFGMNPERPESKLWRRRESIRNQVKAAYEW